MNERRVATRPTVKPMWRCPKCGEQIDPEFDACWNCGTGRDGTLAADFQAEPDDRAVPDPGPVPDEPNEIAPEPGEANERIVELCSAADVVEAQGLCDLLEREGIAARVVGDVLGNAAGCLPLGEPITPRVWVRQSDVPRIREVIGRWLKDQESNPAEWNGIDSPPDGKETAEPEEDALPSDVRFRFLSQGFYIIGVICILVGAYWAWQNRLILSEYSATAGGQWIGDRIVGVKSISTPGSDDLFFHKPHGYVPVKRPQYVYVVNGEPYYAEGNDAGIASDRVPIHYKPDHPHVHVVGPITPPWIILVFAVGLGAFSTFVGYKFR